MELSASQEDYLEAILGLIGQTGSARVRDIAERLSVAKSSVTVALRALAKRELVNYEPYELVTLTDQGQVLAERVRRRHKALSGFFTDVLNVDEAVAEANACRIEHAVGDGVMRRLRCFVEFMSDSSVTAKALPRAFREYCTQRGRSGGCEGCKASADRGVAAASSLRSQGDRNEQGK